MKEVKRLTSLTSKLDKLVIKQSKLKQSIEEFKKRYGTRNAKLTAPQLEKKQALKDKYKQNNTTISETKKELKKLTRMVKKKGGMTDQQTSLTMTDVYENLFKYMKNKDIIKHLTTFYNTVPVDKRVFLSPSDLKQYIDIINESKIAKCQRDGDPDFLKNRNFIVSAESYIHNQLRADKRKVKRANFNLRSCNTIKKHDLYNTRMYYINEFYNILESYLETNYDIVGDIIKRKAIEKVTIEMIQKDMILKYKSNQNFFKEKFKNYKTDVITITEPFTYLDYQPVTITYTIHRKQERLQIWRKPKVSWFIHNTPINIDKLTKYSDDVNRFFQENGIMSYNSNYDLEYNNKTLQNINNYYITEEEEVKSELLRILDNKQLRYEKYSVVEGEQIYATSIPHIKIFENGSIRSVSLDLSVACITSPNHPFTIVDTATAEAQRQELKQI